MTPYERGFLTKCAEYGLTEEESNQLLVKYAWPWSKPQQPQFDYSSAEIDTSVGNNGYSKDVPAFAFYKNEPAELRRRRLNKEIAAWSQQNQANQDAFAAQHGIQPTAQTTAGAVWNGLTDANGWKDGAKLVGKGFVDTAADLGQTAASAGRLVGDVYKTYTGDNSMTNYFQDAYNGVESWKNNVNSGIVNSMNDESLIDSGFIRGANALQRFGTAGAVMAAPGALIGTGGKAMQGANVVAKAPSPFSKLNNARRIVSTSMNAYRRFDDAFSEG